MSVKITAFEAENVKRIKAVTITPEASGLTVIGGNNNQGKTSVLDAIAWALGGNKFRPEGAQRDGSVNPPHLRIRLSNGLLVERKGKNSDLVVTDATGKRGGQQILDAFVSQLALDLPRFMEAGDKEKADTLLRILGIEEDLMAIEREIKSVYDKRTAIGQIADQKKKFAAEMQDYPEAPEQHISASDLILRQQAILAKNGENRRLRDRKEQLEQTVRLLTDSLEDTQRRLQQISDQRDRAVAELQDAINATMGLQDESTEALEEDIRNVEAINAKVEANVRKAKAVDEAEQYAAQYQDLTARLEEVRKERLNLLNGAKLPLPGLDVTDGRLTYFGKHWKDISSSDQLRVATAIVRKLNPNCGFVLLDKLEQMDLNTLAEFSEWLRQEGLQAIATRVSTGGECQIIIEDGRIAEEPEPAPKPYQKGVF